LTDKLNHRGPAAPDDADGACGPVVVVGKKSQMRRQPPERLRTVSLSIKKKKGTLRHRLGQCGLCFKWEFFATFSRYELGEYPNPRISRPKIIWDRFKPVRGTLGPPLAAVAGRQG